MKFQKLQLPDKTICEMYLNKVKISKICSKFNISVTPIYRILRESNVPIQSQSEAARLFHNIDENYFSTIDSERKAYFLGLIFADGCVHGNALSINLEASDDAILQEIQNDICPERALTTIPPHSFSIRGCSGMSKAQKLFSVTSSIILKDLAALGVHSNKSQTIRFPVLRPNMRRHFVRGYFDGDGSVCFNNANKNLAISFAGNLIFCQQLREYINTCVESGGCVYSSKTAKCSTLSFTGTNQCLRLADWLYKDATVFLARKKNKFDAYRK